MGWWNQHKHWLGMGRRVPAHWQNRLWQDIPLLAIDLELTSLDTNVAAITSIGWVAGINGQIDINSAFYQVVNTPADLQQSPVIHGLTAEHIAQGNELGPALEQLYSMLHSHLWVFHHAPLDMQILSRELTQRQMDYNGLLTLDTLGLEKYIMERSQAVFSRHSFTLPDCRHRYQFPPAPVHNALDDAMATLELVYAQLNQLKAMPHQVEDLFHTRSLQAYF
ncbi:MAG: 3'-5' exonuclease [Paraglaciecola sp.]|nr:3'-5' exonuclease [Paraglaciecola sp.]